MILEQSKRKLYFIDGPVPSADERAEAIKLGCTAIRNVRHVQPGKLEEAAAVAGKFPAEYKNVRGVKCIPSEVTSGPWQPVGPKSVEAQPAGKGK